MPLWQSDDYYYLHNEKILKLEKFSFGHAMEKKEFNDINYIYYIPTSFIIGITGTFLGLCIFIILVFTYLIQIRQKIIT